MDDEKIIDELRKRIASLEKTASLGFLLPAVVHEINNPLSVILIGVDTLGRQIEASEALDRHLGMLEQQTERILHLNERLQDWSKWNLHVAERVDARDLVSTFADVEEALGGADDRPALELAEEPIEVEVDPQQLMGVLRFLARAARELGGQGGQHDLRLTLTREQVALIDLPLSRRSPTREFAVFRLAVGAPESQAMPITDWLGDFFAHVPETRMAELMASWELVRKLAGKLHLVADDGGAEIQLMVPVAPEESP